MPAHYIFRQARPNDAAVLAQIKYDQAKHTERIARADEAVLRYCVVAQASTDRPVAFGLLVLDQPSGWPRMVHLPQLIDLYVRLDLRGRGIGTMLIAGMEDLARRAGCREMLLGVDPEGNPLAKRLYERLGYVAIEETPCEDHWHYTDAQGITHECVEWIIHMRKDL